MIHIHEDDTVHSLEDSYQDIVTALTWYRHYREVQDAYNARRKDSYQPTGRPMGRPPKPKAEGPKRPVGRPRKTPVEVQI